MREPIFARDEWSRHGRIMPPCMAGVMLVAVQGAEYDFCPYLTARHFTLPNFGSLFGGSLSVFSAASSSMLANYVYDAVKSYVPVLWALLPALAIAAFLFVVMGPYPARRERRSQGLGYVAA